MKFIYEKSEWNNIVKTFQNWDIYYLYEYAHSLELHGDGIPVLLYWKQEDVEICYVMMLEDIAEFSGFGGKLPRNQYYDLTTPYGYGGPLYKGEITESVCNDFLIDLKKACLKRKIVTQFFRFDAMVDGQEQFFSMFESKSFKNTIYIDLTDEETIMKNMDPKNRNMIRKAIKNQVEIIHDSGEQIEAFIDIYNQTMQRNQAEDYYYFKREYFDYLCESMKENMEFFYAVYDGKIISATIILYNENYMHYHLSGTLWEYKNVASMNLMLYEAAVWGSKKGIKKMHLGGGIEANDSLFGFKKQFNRQGAVPFTIGRTIFNQEIFDELVEKRAEVDENFNKEKPFMIKYRG